jgi:hypothetical protein
MVMEFRDDRIGKKEKRTKRTKRVDPSLCVRKTCLFHHFPNSEDTQKKKKKKRRAAGWMALLPVINVVPPHSPRWM